MLLHVAMHNTSFLFVQVTYIFLCTNLRNRSLNHFNRKPHQAEDLTSLLGHHNRSQDMALVANDCPEYKQGQSPLKYVMQS